MVDSSDENLLEYPNTDSGGLMKKHNLICVLICTVLLNAACKDKAEEEPVVPPVETTQVVETSAVLDVDTIPATEQAPGMPPVPKGSGYAVQVASSTDEDYARSQIELWKKRGYEPFVSTISHDNQTHYRIRLGLFTTEAEAKRAAEQLNDKYSVKAWVDQMTD